MSNTLLAAIESGAYHSAFERLYGSRADAQNARYFSAVRSFESIFGPREDCRLFSAPGRSEIAGNHTDHQNGLVLAAAVTLDILAVVSPNPDGFIRMKSPGYPLLKINARELTPRKNERATSHALVRGVAGALKHAGFAIGGFDAFVVSDVPKGAGLSSSAAYSVLIGRILSGLYNEGSIPPLTLALAAKHAENRYFFKPSGLMDQLACAEGGFTRIDFVSPEQPQVEHIDCDLRALGFSFCIVSPGGSHAKLTQEYASIPQEMYSVAAYFGKQNLREVNVDMFYDALNTLRSHVSDRAILRSLHFFSENARVPQIAQALKDRDMARVLALLRASGASSEQLLQNICPASPQERSLSLALALSARLLDGRGAWRVHGGGFAGTILACMPSGDIPAYVAEMERVFGKDCCYLPEIRPAGGTEVLAVS